VCPELSEETSDRGERKGSETAKVDLMASRTKARKKPGKTAKTTTRRKSKWMTVPAYCRYRRGEGYKRSETSSNLRSAGTLKHGYLKRKNTLEKTAKTDRHDKHAWKDRKLSRRENTELLRSRASMRNSHEWRNL
jgi:hypothetical protein